MDLSLPSSALAPELTLICASLTGDFAENNSRTGPQIQALNHSEHRNRNAGVAMLNGFGTKTLAFVAKPDSKLGIGRVISIVQEDIFLALDVG